MVFGDKEEGYFTTLSIATVPFRIDLKKKELGYKVTGSIGGVVNITPVNNIKLEIVPPRKEGVGIHQAKLSLSGKYDTDAMPAAYVIANITVKAGRKKGVIPLLFLAQKKE